jgi:hypothetical protein
LVDKLVERLVVLMDDKTVAMMVDLMARFSVAELVVWTENEWALQ